MAGIWIYSEEIEVAYQLLTIGRTLADQLCEKVGVMILPADSAKEMIARGADQVISFMGELALPEHYAKSISGQMTAVKPTVLLVGGTLRGKTVAARIAANLKAGLINSALSIKAEDGKLQTTRIMYGGLAVCTEELSDGCIVTIDPRTYEAAMPAPARIGEITQIPAETDTSAVTTGNVCPIVRQSADIALAEKIVCVGRGVGKQEDMTLAKDLAAKLGAALGCTRSIAEDYHWLPSESYIGLSGAKIKPSLYLSFGVSGQIQHVAGIRDSKVIAAIDSNENAPIFTAADYGIVGDLNEIVPLLLKKIAK